MKLWKQYLLGMQAPWLHRKHSMCFRNILKQYFELWSQWIHRKGRRMGEELIQFVGLGFFLSVFSIFQWLGAHYACFGQDRRTSLGHLPWKRCTEGPQWSHLPLVVLAQCVCSLCFIPGQMRCPLSPCDNLGQNHIPMVSPPAVWCLRWCEGKGCRATPQVQGHCSPTAPGKEMDLSWISHPNHCLPIYVLSSFPCIVLVFYGTQKQYKNHSCVLPHY